jgi:predicted protein tyrosine phosphatase
MAAITISGVVVERLKLDQLQLQTAGTAHRVDNNVFIGGYLVAADAGFIKENAITRVVKLFADDSTYYGGDARLPGVNYLVLPIVDAVDEDIKTAAVAAVRFIQEGLLHNEIILVHCHAGVSRSATVVLLYLMVVRRCSLQNALALLRSIRSVVNPNPGFMAFLRATDARIKTLRERVRPPKAP